MLLFYLNYTVNISIDAISGEGKYRPSLKLNPMKRVCMYVYIICMYSLHMYVYILVMKFRLNK